MKKHGVIFGWRGSDGEKRTQWFEHERDARNFFDAVKNIPGREAEYIRRFDPVADVKAFHEKFTINYDGLPRMLDFEILQFRLKFMREELREYEDHADKVQFELSNVREKVNGEYPCHSRPQTEWCDHDGPGGFMGHTCHRSLDQAALTHELAQCLDALMDEMYVVLGTAHLHGFDVYTAWDRVHQANMAKILVMNPNNADEKMKLKISKPTGWEPPRHDDLVEINTHTCTASGMANSCDQEEGA